LSAIAPTQTPGYSAFQSPWFGRRLWDSAGPFRLHIAEAPFAELAAEIKAWDEVAFVETYKGHEDSCESLSSVLGLTSE
jgi:hypothetical protein